jgi:hypothetical protein
VKPTRWSGTVTGLCRGIERTTARAGAGSLTVTTGFVPGEWAFAAAAGRAGAARLGFGTGVRFAGFCGARTPSDDVGC